MGVLGVSVLRMQRHTYTRTGRVKAVTADEYHTGGTTDAAPVTGLPCRYMPTDTAQLSEEGDVVALAPALHVPMSDPIAVGDTVTDVATIDRDGAPVVLAAGPLYVADVVLVAGLGVPAEKRCELSGARLGS